MSNDSPRIMKVGLLQMQSSGTDRDTNLKKADAFCRTAALRGADIALFPDMFSNAYEGFRGESDEEARKTWASLAIGRDSGYVKHFENLAKELDMAIAVTYLEDWPAAPRNTVTLIDRHGEQRMTYAKVHTCDFGKQEAACTPGDGFHVTMLDTRHGPIEVGAMICYDREFPESARVLMLKGAEIILTPNACDLEHNRLDQFKARAWENALAVFMTNYPKPKNNGHSVGFGPEGETLVLGHESEALFIAEIDLDHLREYRSATTYWGNAFRRPHKYEGLLDTAVAPTFERKNAFGEPFERLKR